MLLRIFAELALRDRFSSVLSIMDRPSVRTILVPVVLAVPLFCALAAEQPAPAPAAAPADKIKGPEHNVTLAEEPAVLELFAKAAKARARAEKEPEVWPECVKAYAEILRKFPNTVYLDRWENADNSDMAFKNGLYKS